MKTVMSFGNPVGQQGQQGFAEQTAKRLAGNISFGSGGNVEPALPGGQNNGSDQNIMCWKASGLSPAAPNTDFTIQHQLHYIPLAFIINPVGQAAIFYRSTTPWTAATDSAPGIAVLRCDHATVGYTVVLI